MKVIFPDVSMDRVARLCRYVVGDGEVTTSVGDTPTPDVVANFVKIKSITYAEGNYTVELEMHQRVEGKPVDKKYLVAIYQIISF